MQGSFNIDLGGGVSLDALTLFDSRMLVMAGSGGGKSWLLRRIAEQTANRVQTIILDPEGEFASLRSEVKMLLVGKKHADIPCDVSTAKELARGIYKTRMSAIVDLSVLQDGDGKMTAISLRRKYVRLFLDSLMAAAYRSPRHIILILDEAHNYCPQQIGKECESKNAVIALCDQGRKRGICAILATQRFSKLDKDAVAEFPIVLIGRTILPADQFRGGESLGLDKPATRLLELRKLQPGDFYGVGPALGEGHTEVTRFRVGPCKSEHPKVGTGLEFIPPPTPKAIQKLLPELEAIRAKAVAEIEDMDAANKRIAELEKDLRAKERALVQGAKGTRGVSGMTEADLLASGKYVARSELVRVERDASRSLASVQAAAVRELAALRKEAEGEISRLKRGMKGHIDRFNKQMKRLEVVPSIHVSSVAVLDDMAAMIGEVVEWSRSAEGIAVLGNGNGNGVAHGSNGTQGVPVARPANGGQGSALGKCERAIVNVLGRFPEGRTSRQVGMQSGYSHRSGSFNNSLSKLRSAGIIEGTKSGLTLTEAGRIEYGPFDKVLNGSSLQDYWFSKLSKCETQILSVLIAVHPKTLNKIEIAERTEAGYSAASGSFNNSLSKLRVAELIEGSKEMKASDDLFVLEPTE